MPRRGLGGTAFGGGLQGLDLAPDGLLWAPGAAVELAASGRGGGAQPLSRGSPLASFALSR